MSRRKEDEAGRRIKGRGAESRTESGGGGAVAGYESLPDSGSGAGPQRSVEGWVVFVTGIYEETQDEDIMDKFGEFGTVKAVNMPMDRRTGFIKGYAFVEYETKQEAQAAIEGASGFELLGSTITVDWAFSQGPSRRRTTTRRRE